MASWYVAISFSVCFHLFSFAASSHVSLFFKSFPLDSTIFFHSDESVEVVLPSFSIVQYFCSFRCRIDAWPPLRCVFHPSVFTREAMLMADRHLSFLCVYIHRLNLYGRVFVRLSCAPFDVVDPNFVFILNSTCAVVSVVLKWDAAVLVVPEIRPSVSSLSLWSAHFHFFRDLSCPFRIFLLCSCAHLVLFLRKVDQILFFIVGIACAVVCVVFN